MKTAPTSERLARLTKLSSDERATLAADLSTEFEEADKSQDADAMSEALRGLTRLDIFEELIAETEDVEDAEDDGDNDAGSEDDEPDNAEDDPDEEPSEPAEPEKKGKAGTKKKAKGKADESVKAEEPTEAEATDENTQPDEPEKKDPPATDQPRAASEDSSPEAAAEGADTEEMTAMAASAVTASELQPKEDTEPEGMLAVVASAGIQVGRYASGEKFGSYDDIAQAMVDKLHSIAGAPRDGTRSVVASLRADFPENRWLNEVDSIGNQHRIDDVTSIQAVTASGGFCAPLPVNYNIFGVGSTIRPVRDALPTFGATRGGIRYIVPPLLGAYTGAIATWTAENDENPTTPATKPVLAVTCATEGQALVDALPMTLQFGNLMTRAFPELVQRHNQLALIEHARYAEKVLLSKISALSTKVTSAHERGTVRDILFSLSRAAAAYRNRHRIPRPVALRAIFPEWVRDAMREDVATNLAKGVEDLTLADAVIDRWFAVRGISPVWHIDDTFAAQTPGGAINDFPNTVKFWLYTEGTLLFLDGGTLDLGVVRDADLVATNDYTTFVETFEGVAKVGIEVLEVTATTELGLPAAA